MSIVKRSQNVEYGRLKKLNCIAEKRVGNFGSTTRRVLNRVFGGVGKWKREKKYRRRMMEKRV